MNPGEHLPVIRISFGVQAPLHGRIEFQIGSRTTSMRTWYAEAKESDITGNAKIEFVPDNPPWPKETPKPRNDEPQFEPAKELLESMLENPDPDTQGLSVITKRVPGDFGITRFYPTSGPGGNAPGWDTDDLNQAVSELVSLGWLKFRGSDGGRKVYSLIKKRRETNGSN